MADASKCKGQIHCGNPRYFAPFWAASRAIRSRRRQWDGDAWGILLALSERIIKFALFQSAAIQPTRHECQCFPNWDDFRICGGKKIVPIRLPKGPLLTGRFVLCPYKTCRWCRNHFNDVSSRIPLFEISHMSDFHAASLGLRVICRSKTLYLCFNDLNESDDLRLIISEH